MKQTLYIGSYTEMLSPDYGGSGRGIYTVQLDLVSGELNPLHVEYSRNPSYLALSADNRFLYAVSEVAKDDGPVVRAYAIETDFSLRPLNENPIPGGYPCHIATYADQVFVACYETGNMVQFPLEPTGELKAIQNNFKHTGSSINTARQEAPHAHQVAFQPYSKDIYVCDLGMDIIKAYRFGNLGWEPDSDKDCKVAPGGGPRHMVFSADASLAYVINELTSVVSVLENADGKYREAHTYASLPGEYQGMPSGSAIRIHPNGKFLYVANRIVDALTLFGIHGNQLELLAHQYTGGKEIREFNISPDGQWLLACHQNSHDIVVYGIQGDGTLVESYRTKDILSPVCVVFHNKV
ncbi:MAG: lactonase family protein [Bacteroidota bacterium]